MILVVFSDTWLWSYSWTMLQGCIQQDSMP